MNWLASGFETMKSGSPEPYLAAALHPSKPSMTALKSTKVVDTCEARRARVLLTERVDIRDNIMVSGRAA